MKLVLATACVVKVDQVIYKQGLPLLLPFLRSPQPGSGSKRHVCIFTPKTSAADLTVLQTQVAQTANNAILPL